METDLRGLANQCRAAAPAHLWDRGTRLGGDPWPGQMGASRPGRAAASPKGPRPPHSEFRRPLPLPNMAKGRCHPRVGPVSTGQEPLSH